MDLRLHVFDPLTGKWVPSTGGLGGGNGSGDGLTLAQTDARYDAIGAATAAVGAHAGATDPHTTYLNATRGDARYYTKPQTDTVVNAAVALHVTDNDPHTKYLTQQRGDARYITQTTGDSRYIRDAVLYAMGGDSIANVTGLTTNHDWRTPPNTAALNPEKYAAQISMQSGGWLRLVANCGISGENTAQFLARDSAAASATRRAMTDGANLGATLMLNSIGINDIQQNVYSTTAAATRDTWLTGTLYPAIERILRRQKALGMEPAYMSLTGYDFGTFAAANPSMFPNGAADAAARRTCAALVNAYVRDVLIPSLGFGLYIDLFSTLCNADGTWKAGMSIDGLHPSKLGAQAGAQIIVSTFFGGTQDPRTARKLYRPGGANGANIWQNPTMEATGGNGSAGVAAVYAVGGGTATFANSVAQAYGRYWHSSVCTPTAVDGTYGCTGMEIDFTLPIYGASPVTAFAAGDLLGVEAVVVIDKGTENVACDDLIAFAGRARVWYAAGASSYYIDCIAYDLTVANQVTLTGVQMLKFTIPALKVPDASANLTDAKFSVFAFSRNLKPFRVLVSGISAVKLPAGF